MSCILILAALSLFQPLAVQAHGAVSQLSIGGKSYKGPIAMQTGNPVLSNTIIRQIFGGGPITDVNSKDMACGISPEHANLVAPAMPGDEIAVTWKGTDMTSNWPHIYGPMFAYLASCGSKKCSDFNPVNAKWFKIAQSGGNADGSWGQKVLPNGAYKYKLPSNLAPGGYLLRNEVVNLALVTDAEVFPSCAQIQVGGSETGKPQASDLVSIPGAYKKTQFVNDRMTDITFSHPSQYQMPGPKIATLVSGGSSEPPADPSPSDDSDSKAPAKNVAAAPPKASASSTRAMTKTRTSTKAAPSASKTSSSKPALNTAKCTMSRKARRSLNANFDASIPDTAMEPVHYYRHHRARAGKLAIGHASL